MKKIIPWIIKPLSSSLLIENTHIYWIIFIAIPENPCPEERATIISKGKLPAKPKNPAQHKALMNPINTTRPPVIITFLISSFPKSIVVNGINIRNTIEPIIPPINWNFNEKRSLLQKIKNWKTILRK